MSWSPDSQWLCYTVAAGSEGDTLQPGWLFETSRDGLESRVPAGLLRQKAPEPAAVYRIWASHQDGRSSVLIEESRWPLTTASWSPRGRSVAFGRFVPQSIEPDQAGQHGRFEVVVQNGLDRKDVVWTSSDFELDAETQASFPHLVCSWSPDGLYLAIPRPGRQPAIVIVRTDTKKRLQILDHAILPAWSPDGSKCAFVRRENGYNNLEVVERRGQSFGAARKVVATGPVTATPFWSNDGRSILAVIERPTSRSPELELVPLHPGPGHDRGDSSLEPGSGTCAAEGDRSRCGDRFRSRGGTVLLLGRPGGPGLRRGLEHSATTRLISGSIRWTSVNGSGLSRYLPTVDCWRCDSACRAACRRRPSPTTRPKRPR